MSNEPIDSYASCFGQKEKFHPECMSCKEGKECWEASEGKVLIIYSKKTLNGDKEDAR
jgi:hypothetical protein